jgi:RPA family protein
MNTRRIPPRLRLAFWHFCADVMEEAREREEGKCRPWTDDDTEKLMSMRAAGVDNNKIAGMLNRTPHSCNAKYSTVCRGGKAQGNAWTSAEEAMLVDMWVDGASYNEIAEALGRTKMACHTRMSLINKRGN